MNIYKQINYQLQQIEQAMHDLGLWEVCAPPAAAFASTEPFCIDRMRAEQWLQWVFLPRMYALLEAHGELPTNCAIAPYIEEVMKNEKQDYTPLILVLKKLDALLTQDY